MKTIQGGVECKLSGDGAMHTRTARIIPRHLLIALEMGDMPVAIDVGEDGSRRNTLRALRVLDWYAKSG